MAVLNQSFSSLESMVKKVFHPDTPMPTFIMPSLELKKQMVEQLALRFGTVPDHSILRLNEFFTRQVQELAPEMQFLDKDLLSLVLKMNLNTREEFKKYTAFIDVALDYISIFSPILGRDVYRQALEDLIEHDEHFLKNYGDIYGFLTSVWDNLLRAKQVLPAWSLGWLFLHLPQLEKQDKTLYIMGYQNLKEIEQEFFTELANSWTIINLEFENDILDEVEASRGRAETIVSGVQAETTASRGQAETTASGEQGETTASRGQVKTTASKGQGKENVYSVFKVISPIDEVRLCLQILKQSAEAQTINIVAPKTKWFYKNIIEIFLKKEDEGQNYTEEESFREQMNSFLSPLRLHEGSYEQSDLQRIWSQEKPQFKNEKAFKKTTSEMFDSQKILQLNKHLQSFSIPSSAISFIDFLDMCLASHPDPECFDKVLRKLYPITLQIPKHIKLDIGSWLQFVSLKLDKVSPQIRSKKINFYTLEEARWAQGETNIFLSCTRQDYDRNPFAYLSDYEVEKIHSDLGFNLEGMNPVTSFEEALETHSHKGMTHYFMVPTFDFIGTSQQPSQIVQNLIKNGARVQSIEDLSFAIPSLDGTSDSARPGGSNGSSSSNRPGGSGGRNGLEGSGGSDESNGSEGAEPDGSGLQALRLSAPRIIRSLGDTSRCGVTSYQPQSLSASAIETYITAPYEFFLRYVLGMGDEDPLEVDPSPQLKGIVFHEILARFLDQTQVTEEAIKNLIRDRAKEVYQYWASTQSVELQIARYAAGLCEYFELDRQRKARTGTRTIALEQKYVAYFDLTDLRFYKEEQKGRVQFRGTIDRIDECQGSLYILDYKSRSLNSIARNLTKQALIQMPLYAMIIEDGILDVQGELAGLLYVSIASNFQDAPALVLKDHDKKYLEKELHYNSQALVTESKFKQIIDEYRLYLKNVIIEIQDNNFESWTKDHRGDVHLINVDF